MKFSRQNRRDSRLCSHPATFCPPLKLQEEIEIPVSAKQQWWMEKKFGDKETIKLIKFIEQNADMLKSTNTTVRVQWKERLWDRLTCLFIGPRSLEVCDLRGFQFVAKQDVVEGTDR